MPTGSRRRRGVLVLLALLAAAGCNTSYPPVYTAPSARADPATAPAVLVDVVEYRVTGTAAAAVVRFSNATDGLTQVTTSLPYTVTFRTPDPLYGLFLSLDATPIGSSATTAAAFLNVQIFVNGALFREASAGTLGTTLAVSGTWRR